MRGHIAFCLSIRFTILRLLESQPQNPEFRNNSENSHPYLCDKFQNFMSLFIFSLCNWTHYYPNFIKVRGHIAFCLSIQFRIFRLLESPPQHPEFRINSENSHPHKRDKYQFFFLQIDHNLHMKSTTYICKHFSHMIDTYMFKDFDII